MKKGFLIPIIIGSLLLTGATVLVSVAAISEAINNKPVTNEYVFKDEETFTYITFSSSVSDLELKYSTTERKIIFEETTKYYHEVKIENDTLKITQVSNRRWYEFIDFGIRVKATLILPITTYNSLLFNSSTGDLVIPSEYEFDSLTASVSTGNINIKSNHLGNVSVKSSTGNVNMTNTSVSETIKIDTSTGNVNLKNVTAKNLETEVSTGHVTLTESVMSEKITITSSTGDVLFNNADADSLKIHTSTGDVKGVLLTSKIFYCKTTTGKINVPLSTTGGLCEVETSTGDIILSVKQA